MTKRGIRTVAALAVIPLFFLALVACSDDDDDVASSATAVGGAETELCQELRELETAVSQTDNLSASSTVDSAQQSMTEVREATEGVREAAAGVAEAQVSLIQTAQNALQSALDGVSGDQSLGQAATAIRAQAGTIARTVDSVQSDTGCP